MAKVDRIGFVGLGAMGMAMGTQLINHGFQVSACDARAEVKNRWTSLGGIWRDTPAEAAKGAEAFLVMVVDAEQVDSVLFGADGAVPHLSSGSVVIVTSTVPPAYSQSLGRRLEDAGHRFLDAPVSGGVVGAEAGKLSVMASGSDQAFEKAQPVLEAMAAKIYRIGTEPGLGSVVKAVNQLLTGSHIALAAEAMAFGIRAGVDPKRLYEVICNSAGASWAFNDRVPKMLSGDFTPHSAVNIFLKDLGIVLDLARELKFPVPMTALAHQLFLMAAAHGWGAQDDASVVKVFEALSGICVSTKTEAGTN